MLLERVTFVLLNVTHECLKVPKMWYAIAAACNMAIVASAEEDKRVRIGIEASAWAVPFCPPEVVVVLAMWADGSSPYGWRVHAVWQDRNRGRRPKVPLLP